MSNILIGILVTVGVFAYVLVGAVLHTKLDSLKRQMRDLRDYMSSDEWYSLNNSIVSAVVIFTPVALGYLIVWSHTLKALQHKDKEAKEKKLMEEFLKENQ